MIVFGHHKKVLDGLQAKLGKAYHAVRIDGSTSMEARKQAMDSFQQRKQVRLAILSITAAGVYMLTAMTCPKTPNVITLSCKSLLSLNIWIVNLHIWLPVYKWQACKHLCPLWTIHCLDTLRSVQGPVCACGSPADIQHHSNNDNSNDNNCY